MARGDIPVMDFNKLNIDTEDFITEIEAHPSIWDSSNEEYANKIVKKNSWETIITKFIPNFKDSSSSEKNNIGKFINILF